MDINTINQNRNFIENLRKEVTSQLKNSPWEPGYGRGFFNKHFNFYTSDNTWWMSLKYDRYNNSDKIKVTEIIPIWKFHFFKFFFVNRSLKNHKKIMREAEIAKYSNNFFEANKDLKRDNKINQILEK